MPLAACFIIGCLCKVVEKDLVLENEWGTLPVTYLFLAQSCISGVLGTHAASHGR
jgi:hypothetical protein